MATPEDAAPSRVTMLLDRLRDGDPKALDQLVPLIHAELRQIARAQMRNERSGHTLQATALAHEAYLRLVRLENQDWRDRTHFLGVAAAIMRRLLIDHARKHGAARRGSGATHIELDEAAVLSGTDRSDELLALDDALARLAALDERQARIVELRFFAGLGVEETAAALGISERTVKREWSVARAWLRAELGR
jgi:RNA polymerase sigma factor (TIGR02999 family)